MPKKRYYDKNDDTLSRAKQSYRKILEKDDKAKREIRNNPPKRKPKRKK